jgi:hypothetical protein
METRDSAVLSAWYRLCERGRGQTGAFARRERERPRVGTGRLPTRGREMDDEGSALASSRRSDAHAERKRNETFPRPGAKHKCNSCVAPWTRRERSRRESGCKTRGAAEALRVRGEMRAAARKQGGAPPAQLASLVAKLTSEIRRSDRERRRPSSNPVVARALVRRGLTERSKEIVGPRLRGHLSGSLSRGPSACQLTNGAAVRRVRPQR